MKFLVNEATGQTVARVPDDWDGVCPSGCRLVQNEKAAHRTLAEERAALDAERRQLEAMRSELEARRRDNDWKLRQRILEVERREASCRRIEKGLGRGAKGR